MVLPQEPTERVPTPRSRWRIDAGNLLVAGVALLGTALGGFISYATTRSQEQHQDAQAQAATIQTRAGALVATGYKIESAVLADDDGSEYSAIQQLEVTLHSEESSLLFATTTQPTTDDVIKVTTVIEHLANGEAYNSAAAASFVVAQYQSAVQRLEHDINPTLHLAPPTSFPPLLGH
jgi:hypothetical protein